MRVGIDFDRVLFKTDEFKQHLFDRFESFEETYEEAEINGFYNPQKHAELMGTTVEEIFDELQNTSEFLYDDVEKLKQLQERFEVIIVSRGDPVFQKGKIVDSGVQEYVDGYELVQKKPKDSVNIDFLVDDRQKEIERVDVPGFLFKRPDHTIEDVIREVRNLNG